MLINYPCIITARLLPGIKVGDATISIEYGDWTNDGRIGYRYYIDFSAGYEIREYTGNDLSSGVGGGSLQSGLESLLGFLGACGESVKYGDTNDPDSNANLFPTAVAQWAAENSDDLAIACCELEETANAIIEDQEEMA